MSATNAVHTFRKGMIKDLDKSLISADAYYEATNFRTVTSKGLSTGSLENLEGNNIMSMALSSAATLVVGSTYMVVSDTVTYNGSNYTVGGSFEVVTGVTSFSNTGYVINANLVCPSGYYIIGSVELRGDIVLFITNNTNSRILLVKYNETTEKVTSVTVCYDDSDNNNTGSLSFNTEHLIKAVARYETPNIKKVYWTDGINTIKYIDVAKYNTTDGLVKSSSNYYMSLDLLEFIPGMTINKPSLSNMITGELKPGTVQYAYQYFKLNGSETVFSPLSDTIHITSKSDSSSTSYYYRGEGNPDVNSGKGCEVYIPLDDSDKYNKVRIIRLHYSTINSIPTITIVGELDINSTWDSLTFKDTGVNILGELTIEELNLPATEMFVCQDLDVKDNILFAANISKSDSFDIGDWDSRAVRFRNYITLVPGTDATTPTNFIHNNSCTFNFIDVDTIQVTIPTFTSNIPAGRTITSVTAVGTSIDDGTDVINGVYDTSVNFNSTGLTTSFSNVVYTSGTDTLVFNVTTSSTDYFTGVPTTIDSGNIYFLVISYSYTTESSAVSALVQSATEADVPISVPANVALPASWDAAGWTGYTETYDGINPFNDTDNDFTATEQYKYKSDGLTLGAEGPNVEIEFETESILLDDYQLITGTSVTSEDTATNKSYKSYASPFKSGKRSWQRDETYRLYVVFFNDRGLPSLPKWICDLRMPSLHETGNTGKLAYLDSGNVKSYALYPKIKFRNFPAGAVSAQILRVARGTGDRSVLTQGLVVPSTAANFRPDKMSAAVTASRQTHKLISPEVNITKNINYSGSDYLEFVTDFSTVLYSAAVFEVQMYKAQVNNIRARTANERSNLTAAKYVTPSNTTDSVFNYTNYSTANNVFGCSGLIFKHENTADWTTNGVDYCLVNYKRKVFDSQYGGNTFNKRINNVGIPASDILSTTGEFHVCYNGDTFINYMTVYDSLYDLTKTTGNSYLSVILFPVESSINNELQHGFDVFKDFASNIQVSQEAAGEWVNGSSTTYNQLKPMYQYNTVYSQDSTAKFYMNISTENATETEFDCMVKASRVKLNGESSDSWTKFPVNDFIEVDSTYGAITGLMKVNNKLLYWQDNAFGVLAVNDRSLISDSINAQLVLGTGGVLDRHDYVSTTVGTSNRRSIVSSQTAVYWYYDKENSMYRFAEGLENLSKSKLLQSWFRSNVTSNYEPHGVYNPRYNELWFSFYENHLSGHTLIFNESVDAFVSLVSMTPRMYVPIRHGFLNTYYLINSDQLFYNNSALKERCLFNSFTPGGITDAITPETSKLTIVVNDAYPNTKVFDNIFYDTTVTDSNGYEVNLESFDRLRCYNNYQNTGFIDLVYKTNLERRERIWTTVVPRNRVDIAYPALSADVMDAANLDDSRLFKERMRDKYMFVDFEYDNNSNYRMVLPYIGVRYRISPR